MSFLKIVDRGHSASGMPNTESADQFKYVIWDFGNLYDLACRLERDDLEADSLVYATLVDYLNATSSKRDTDAYKCLVRNYLKRNSSLSKRLLRLRKLLRKQKEKKASATSRFEAAFSNLSPLQQVCLLLREKIGLSSIEIALIIEIGTEDVCRTLFLARERLRRSLHTN